MDATKRPLLIPPDFATYAEQHGVFDMYKRLLEQLIIHKPKDPVKLLIELLKRDNDDVPQVVILGPPASGKRTIARSISAKLRAAHLTKENLVLEAESGMRNEAQGYLNKGEEIPTELWVQILKERTGLFDCVKKGWVLEALPETREQAMAFQAIGVNPKHFVLLDAPDTVLIERASGKRIDPETGDIYHTTFDWPNSSEVQGRLEEVPGNTEEELIKKLEIFHRHVDGIQRCYEKRCKVINADQPKADVISQVFSFLTMVTRSVAPHTPRIILLGPTGSGKGVQAALLANKYNIVKVSCGQLLKQAVSDETKAGLAAKTYLDKDNSVPDSIVLTIVKERLGQLDCVSRGWVLYGYPITREQAEQLDRAGFIPNRVFFLNVPNDSVVERLTLRATDHDTGDRYHMLYNPPRTQDVKDRLQRHPKDSDDNVKNRLSQYHAYAEEINDYYLEAQHINADQDPHTVFECIECMVVNPLPKQFDT